MKMNNILKTTALLLGSSVLLSGCIKETFPESGYATSDQTAESPFPLCFTVGILLFTMIITVTFGLTQK